MHASPLLLAALAAPSSPSAAPAAAADFSFAQWVEDIIANPAGAHLSPSEAVEAKNAAVAKSTSPFQKRVNCDRDWARANVRSPLTLAFPSPFLSFQFRSPSTTPAQKQ